ncbi:MAG: 5'-nucleotidase C-terminal domain-containing protein, partial [Gammaproteobacteria bacterium]
GGDMVRVGGIEYTMNLNAKIGHRITDMRIKGKPVDAKKIYKVAGWAPVAEGAEGEPIWEVAAAYLRDKKVIKGLKLNEPKIIGVGRNNPGIAGYKGGMV